MKDAEHYIDIILNRFLSVEDAKKLQPEVNAWYKAASEDQKDIFVQSGAGEVLYMLSSGE